MAYREDSVMLCVRCKSNKATHNEEYRRDGDTIYEETVCDDCRR